MPRVSPMADGNGLAGLAQWVLPSSWRPWSAGSPISPLFGALASVTRLGVAVARKMQQGSAQTATVVESDELLSMDFSRSVPRLHGLSKL